MSVNRYSFHCFNWPFSLRFLWQSLILFWWKEFSGSFLNPTFSGGFRSWYIRRSFLWFYMPFLRKNSNPFCSVTRCIIVLKITLSSPIFSYSEFQWIDSCQLLWSLNNIQPHFMNDLGKFTCFSSGNHLYMFHLNCTKKS